MSVLVAVVDVEKPVRVVCGEYKTYTNTSVLGGNPRSVIEAGPYRRVMRTRDFERQRVTRKFVRLPVRSLNQSIDYPLVKLFH